MATVRGSSMFVWDTSKLLGRGATCAVYLGRNKKTGDEVAVKVFNSQSLQRPFTVQMREFDVMAKLNHDNVVKLLAIEEEVSSRSKVIVMEFCTHGSLYDRLEQPENSFGLSEDEFLLVLAQVSAGIKHLRENDIIHRDIKPGNILRSVAQDGRSVYKLTDFGAARELQEDEEFFSLYGTDEYLHPDIYEKAVLRRSKGQQFGAYVDLWSLGVTFYHASTGNLPFRPYGGRRNKETMHLITSEKEHGMISGVQKRNGGQIEWSRELPLTCQLSKGFKALLTPFLALLLEKDATKTISFDGYFTHVDDIVNRIPYHLFCPSSFSQFIVYTRQKDSSMSELRQLITDQTEIPGHAQLLMLDGKVLTDESCNPVSSCMKYASADNPIFVFNKFPEYKRFVKPAYGTFVDIPQETNVNTDYPHSKQSYAVLHSVTNAVKTLLLSNILLTKAVKMHENYVSNRCAQLELSVGHLTHMCSDTTAWKNLLFANLGLQANMLQILANSNLKPSGVDLMGRVNILQKLCNTGNRECSQINTHIQNKLDKAAALLQDLKTAQMIDTDWDPSTGCLASDRCIAKMELLLQKVLKIVSSFREDKNKRQLSSDDEQIHKFNKNRMKELCLVAQTLIDDNCTRKADLLFSAFKQCYSKANRIHDAGERLDTLILDIGQAQGRLADKLKVSGKQCVAQVESCLKSMEMRESQMEVTDNGDNSGTNVHNGVVVGSRQDRLDNMLDSIQSTRTFIEEVHLLLSENTSIIEKFNSLGGSSEEDKSWEYVP